jgi:hypothetical protein
MKIRPMLAELVRTGGRTDRPTDIVKRIVAFHTFANAPNNGFGYQNIFPSPFASTMNSTLRTLCFYVCSGNSVP